MSVQWLSELAGVAGTVDVGLDQVAMSFKFLESAAGEALEGTDKELIRAFADMHISMQQLSAMSNDPQQLFTSIQQALQGMTDQSTRMRVAQELLGRSSAALLPLLMMTREEYQKNADVIRDLGGTVDEHQAKQGEMVGKLTGYFSALKDGIENAFATPILDYFEKHLDQIVEKMKGAEKEISADVPKIIDAVTAAGKQVINTAEGKGTLPADSVEAAFLSPGGDKDPAHPYTLRRALSAMNGWREDLSESIGDFIGKHHDGKIMRSELGYSPSDDGALGGWNLTPGALPTNLQSHLRLENGLTPGGNAPPSSPTQRAAAAGDGHANLEAVQSGWRDAFQVNPDLVNGMKDVAAAMSTLLNGLVSVIGQVHSPSAPAPASTPSIATASNAAGSRAITIVNASVNVAYDPRETAIQFAAKVEPQIRQLYRARSSPYCGRPAGPGQPDRRRRGIFYWRILNADHRAPRPTQPAKKRLSPPRSPASTAGTSRSIRRPD